MIVELGHFALILAFATSLVQATLPIIGSRQRDLVYGNSPDMRDDRIRPCRILILGAHERLY